MGKFFKNISSVAIFMLLIFLCFAFAISSNESTLELPTQVAKITNPAATFCTENGGKHLVITEKDGSQFGVCNFTDGSSCKAWEFFNRTCKKGDFGTDKQTDQGFEITEVLESSCSEDLECQTPAQYLALSNCQYKTRCLENTCTVICPTSSPITSENNQSPSKTIYCEEDSYNLACVCKTGEKKQIHCPSEMDCPAVIQFECVK